MAKAKSKPKSFAKLHKLYSRKQINAIREELIAKHGDTCAVCGKHSSMFKRRLSVDHNHKTGKIRGLLCFFCNKILVGKHSLETARKVFEYLTQYDKD